MPHTSPHNAECIQPWITEPRPWRRAERLQRWREQPPQGDQWCKYWAALSDPSSLVRDHLARALEHAAEDSLPATAVEHLHDCMDGLNHRGWYHLACVFTPLRGRFPRIDQRLAGALLMIDTQTWQRGDREQVLDLQALWTQHLTPTWVDSLAADGWMDAYVLADDEHRLQLAQAHLAMDAPTVLTTLLAHPQRRHWSWLWPQLHSQPPFWSALFAEGWLQLQRQTLPSPWWASLEKDPPARQAVLDALAATILAAENESHHPRQALRQRQTQEATLASLSEAATFLTDRTQLQRTMLHILEHSNNPDLQARIRRILLQA